MCNWPFYMPGTIVIPGIFSRMKTFYYDGWHFQSVANLGDNSIRNLGGDTTLCNASGILGAILLLLSLTWWVNKTSKIEHDIMTKVMRKSVYHEI
jgi:cell division protein ZapA (FtsZ GTPase activity inhibitor)